MLLINAVHWDLKVFLVDSRTEWRLFRVFSSWIHYSSTRQVKPVNILLEKAKLKKIFNNKSRRPLALLTIYFSLKTIPQLKKPSKIKTDLREELDGGRRAVRSSDVASEGQATTAACTRCGVGTSGAVRPPSLSLLAWGTCGERHPHKHADNTCASHATQTQ